MNDWYAGIGAQVYLATLVAREADMQRFLVAA